MEYKSFETVKVKLDPKDAIAILAGHDRRGEPWQFVGNLPIIAAKGGQNVGSVPLGLWIDGSDTVHEFTLHPDGTWTATTHVTLGEVIPPVAEPT